MQSVRDQIQKTNDKNTASVRWYDKQIAYWRMEKWINRVYLEGKVLIVLKTEHNFERRTVMLKSRGGREENEKLLLSVKETCGLTGLSERTVRTLMAENDFTVRIGRRTLVHKKKFEKWLEKQETWIFFWNVLIFWCTCDLVGKGWKPDIMRCFILF